MNVRYNLRKLVVLLATSVLASQSAKAQDSCLQRRVGPPPAQNASHWIVTNVCGYAVQFKAYMSNAQGTYTVYTTPLGRLVDPNPGFPITVTLNSGSNQSFNFSAPPMTAGQWNFITDDVRQVN